MTLTHCQNYSETKDPLVLCSGDTWQGLGRCGLVKVLARFVFLSGHTSIHTWLHHGFYSSLDRHFFADTPSTTC